MRQIINGVKYWGQLLFLPIYWLSFLFPRNKNIWLFGSTFGRRFADNPRYFYLYVSQHSSQGSEQIERSMQSGEGQNYEWQQDENCKDIRPIWISHNREIAAFLQKNGYEAYYYHSMKGIWYCLRGKVYLFDNYAKDISFWLSGGAVKINLWHGIPLKKIQHDNIFDRFRHPAGFRERIYNYPRNISDEKPHHYVLTTSEFMKPIFSSAFQTENVLICGYPRCDRLEGYRINNPLTALEKAAAERIEKQRSCYPDSRVIYYMPTFRTSETDFFTVMDLEAFQRFLSEQRMVFCVKLHPKSKLREQFQKIEGNQIIIIDADADPYVFIEMADALVTDYSSIYFDYLLMDRPILFFNYDLKTYLEDSREMYFNYKEYTPGIKAANQRELEQGLKQIFLADKPENIDIQGEREALRNKMFGRERRSAGERLAGQISGMLNR